jgi:hypothetical protein
VTGLFAGGLGFLLPAVSFTQFGGAVASLFVFAAAWRALAASARFFDSFVRYAPALFSASTRCLRLRSS